MTELRVGLVPQMAWRPVQLPPAQKMPKKRGPKKPSYVARTVAAMAGIALLVTGGIGVWRAFSDVRGGGGSPFMSLAVLLPAIILLRYTITGKIKP